MPEGSVPAALKREVADRARGCCEFCRSQARFAVQEFSVEHILPTSRGGQTQTDNLALACQGCNNHKYAKTDVPDPITGAATPLFHPRRQRWNDHFAWNDDFTLIVGLTPIGRATVEALQLNREGVVNLRRVLFSVGEHPPAEPQDQD